MMRKDNELSSYEVFLIDEVPTVELYAGVLRQSYRVLAASNFNDAEQILHQEHPDILVIEPYIAGEKGWEWVRRIIQIYAIPIMICSSVDERNIGSNLGVSAYLIKPVPPDILYQTISNLLNILP